ncbi:hypothetical protein [Microbispora sp. ATCC PTA-5024]|uniref:hypothetical protein n=1 Tax=Microbispora sp. ATCC PTA-5024 TaxID=316330 RepID=UPI0005682AAF|nr:hypothetical protein [Microbispora sp. ATCC PTA-5024]
MNVIEPHDQLPLYPGEKVLWTDSPTKHRPSVNAGLLVPSGMAAVGLAVMGPALLANFSPFLLVFMLVWEGLALNMGPVRWLRGWRTNRTVRYTATDRRVLVTFRNGGPRSVSYEYQRLGPPQVVHGNIRMEWLGEPGKVVELSDIHDPLIVQDLITRAQAEQRHPL